MQTKPFARVGLLAVIAGGLTLSATAHDEDWRKLRDREDPVVGPIVTLNDLKANVRAAGLSVSTLGTGLAGGVDSEFDSLNVLMMSWVPLSEFAGSHPTGNDCWGYTSPSGREYAIIGLQRGTGFVEITDPVNPVVIDTIDGPNSTWHDIKVMGHYAYSVSEGGRGIQVIDMSRIDEGIVRHVQDKTQMGHTSTHNIVANEESGYLYLVGANIASGGLIAVDISDPEDPTIVGQWSTMYVHDAQVVTYTDGPYAGREIAFCFSGYRGGRDETGLRIVDVTDKSNMFTISEAFWTQAAYSHQGWLTEDRKYIYIDDELDEQTGLVETTTTRIFDVSDITNPTFVDTFTSGSRAIDHNQYVNGNLLYQANYRSGLRIFDISDPVNPEQVGYFDTYPGSDSAQFNGAWSTYPFFASGNIVVSDIERGLFVVRYLDSTSAGVTLQIQGGEPLETIAPSGQMIAVEAIQTTGEVDPSSIVLHVRDSSGERTVPLSAAGAGIFEGEFPELDCFESIEYWVTGQTLSGDAVSAPLGAPFLSYEASVLTGVEVFFEDDFSTDKGWKVGAPDDTAPRGIWNRMMPEQTSTGGAIAQPGFTPTGTACYVTDGRAGSGAGAWDVDEGKTTLFSPVFDLAGSNPVVSYYRWYSNHAGASPYNDIFEIDISNDGGESWTSLEVVGPDGPEASGDWYHVSFRISSYVTPTDRVQFRFVASDYDPQALVEALIDDFRIEELTCDSAPGCYADCDGSGSLDFFDFLCFQNAFSAGDPYADCDGSGELDFFDFLCFQNEFSAGCP